jgi:hypothetical protein
MTPSKQDHLFASLSSGSKGRHPAIGGGVTKNGKGLKVIKIGDDKNEVAEQT